MANKYGRNSETIKYQITIIKDLFPELKVNFFVDTVYYDFVLITGTISDDYGISSLVIEKKGKSIVLDAYNANPTSMILALNSFSEKKGTKSIILGDMFELGLESDKEHKELINFCLKNNFNDIFLIGNEFYKHKNSFNQPNFYKTNDELSNHLKKMPLKSELILIKGSRGMKMENVIKYIF